MALLLKSGRCVNITVVRTIQYLLCSLMVQWKKINTKAPIFLGLLNKENNASKTEKIF
jgi:hypothetical protein